MMIETVAISIPTGIGAEIGGYAGDFGHIAREFSKYFKVIINPNAVNAGVLSAINDNMYYVEGYAFDKFFKGEINLEPAYHKTGCYNKTGVIFDKSIPDKILNLHINTINALKVVKGYDIPYFEITDEGVGVSLIKDKSGVSTGRVENEKTLLDAAKKLIKKGCSALAVVCYFDDECEDEDYNNGCGVDPIGGIEAVISHFLTKELNVPCAHSPAFSGLDITFEKVSPKVASEFISSTYLPCVLDGLSRAPLLKKNDFNKGDTVTREDVKCLIVPDGALGSGAVISALRAGIKVCAVHNPVILSIDCKKFRKNDIIRGTDNLDENLKEFLSYEDCLTFIRKH